MSPSGQGVSWRSLLPVGGVAAHLLAGSLALQAIAIGDRLWGLVGTHSGLGGRCSCSAHGVEGIRLAVHRADGEVLPVGTRHLLGRMDGERHSHCTPTGSGTR